MTSQFKRFWPYLRVVLSLALLWLAVRNIDWRLLAQSQLSIEPWWFVAAFAVILVANMLAAARWGWLMRSAGFEKSFSAYFSLYLSAGLINQGLPSTIGGDSYRAIEGSRRHGKAEESLPSLDQELHEPVDMAKAPARLRVGFLAVLLDRLLGLIGNNLLGAIGLLLAGSVIASWAHLVGLAIIGATLLGGVVAVAILRLRPTRKLLVQLLERLGLIHGLGAIQTAFGWPQIGVQFALALTIHAMAVATLGCCLRAFGAAVPFEALMIGLPALSVLMILPISISGWGLRETTLSAVLVLWGVPTGITVLASVSYGVLNLLIYLPGAIFLLRRGKQGRSAPRH